MSVRDIGIASKKGMAPKDVTNADFGAILMTSKDSLKWLPVTPSFNMDLYYR